MTQRSLFDTSAPAQYDNMPLPPAPDRKAEGERRKESVVDEKARRALNRDAVLALLKQGSATNHELAEVGGNRFGARIHELRKQGHNIEIVLRNGGLTLYRLKEGT
jgi:hypothetical protein